MVASAVCLFAVTYAADKAVSVRNLSLPGWANFGGADAARQVLIGIAAAVITVAGVVFSITILALQLASQQFGPRMLRNFIRDRGTQVSLGAYVATFVYCILTLAVVSTHPSGDFVPHISTTVALALTLADVGILIYFIHHVASSIQLTSVVAGIAKDFRSTLESLQAERFEPPRSADERSQLLLAASRLDRGGTIVPARSSGFLQAVGHDRLVRIAAASDAIIRLLFRPGHFVVQGQPLAVVWPTDAATSISEALASEHIVGPSRTLTQDLGFAIDQLVEVAIRALSPAVNDTFTALNCIDWLGDCLCRASRLHLPTGVYQDANGAVRLMEPSITFERLLKGASDKVRQAGRGMPAVYIRQLENLQKVTASLVDGSSREAIVRQADMIIRASDESVPEPLDRQDVQHAYEALLAALNVTALPAD
jgi:uncharacterized membrane protein